MLWALLAILGVPVWLVVGVLAGALISRRRFKAQPDVFRLKLRDVGDGKWPRRVAYGRIVHDVLIVNGGLALVRTAIRGVRAVEDRPEIDSVPGLEAAAVFEVTFDDGALALLAVDGSSVPHVASLGRSEIR